MWVLLSGLWGSLFLSNASASTAPFYKIQASVDSSKKTVVCRQTTAFTNNSADDLDSLYFHIYPHRAFTQKEKDFMLRYTAYFKVNFFPEGFAVPEMDIQAVSQGTDALNFSIEGEDQTILKVPLKNTLHPGDSVEIKIDFALKIPHSYGRLGWHNNILALSRWYPILSVYGRDGWDNHPFYVFHRPFFSEASLYSVTLTVPQNQVVIHSGQLVREENTTAGTKTLFIESKLPIREFSLAMSPDYKIYEEKWQDVQIKSFYLSGEEKSGQRALGFVRDLMRFYTRLFGPYPYETFSLAPVYLGYGGEQMSNLAFIDTRVYELPGFLNRYFDFLIAHETGHQWFYNRVGIDEFTQMWLEEGVHSYFIEKYLEEKYGPDGEVIDFPAWLQKYKGFLPNLTFKRTRDVRYKTLARIGLDHAVVSKLSSFSEPSSIFSLTYGKGARIVGVLEGMLGEEAFDRVFKRIFKEYDFKNLTVEDFEKICEEESQMDLSSFFQNWLYTDGYFDAAVTKVKGNKVTLKQKGKIAMPVEVEVKFKDGQKVSSTWDGKGKQTQIQFKEGSAIKEVQLDHNEKLLDLDQTNNQWPRKIYFKAVPIYFPLYDIPVFLPEDSYNVVAGPEIANGGLGVKASLQKPFDQILYAGTDYEFGESIHHSRLGWQLNNLFRSPTALGFEVANQTDLDDGDEDLVSGKIYLRKELRPVSDSLFDINDHISLYLIRNQGLNKTLLLGGTEDADNISYLKRSEAIIGTALHLDRSETYPDPRRGFKLDTLLENSGHFFGATQYFYRAAVDTSFYAPVRAKDTLALRLKYGGGYPDDKNLFQLGGIEGLRGFDRKDVRGSSALLGSLEYRFPLREKLHIKFFDNIFSLESVGGAVFFDAGQSWYSSFGESALKKDAGLGLRFTMNLGSMLENMIVRADAAKAINEPEDDIHFWFGVGQAF